MLKKLILIAILFSGIAACKSKTKAAVDYNNDIIAMEKSLEPEVQATENNVKRFYEAGQYDSIALAGEKMEQGIEKRIDQINAMPMPQAKGVDKFKSAVISYYKFIKSLYTDYKEFGKAGTEEKRQEILQDIQKIVNQKQDVLTDMQNAQRKYAEENGFKLNKKAN